MSSIAKLTINWTGFPGGPGYTNLMFAPAAGPDVTQAVVDAAIAKADTWINAMNQFLPSVVKVQLNSAVEIFDDSTGDLLSFMSGSPFQRGNGSGTGAYSAAAGACVNWYTGGVVRGRRVRGRTFVVPLAGSALATDGTLDNTALTTMRTASTALVTNDTDAKLSIWSRPTSSTATDGISFDAISATISDKTAVLRSRRD